MSLVSLSCVNATDSNSTEIELELSDDNSQALEIANVDADENNEEVLQIANADISNDELKTSAYLILDNDADIENAYIGDTVVWIVSIINNGPDTAKNVKVFDQLPDGLKYIKHQATKGTFDSKTGIWDIGDIAVDDGKVFLNITTLALTVGEKINKANLTTDSINLNNETYEEEEIDISEHAKIDELPKIEGKKTMHPTGNPLVLALISLFAIIITSTKSKKS